MSDASSEVVADDAPPNSKPGIPCSGVSSMELRVLEHPPQAQECN